MHPSSTAFQHHLKVMKNRRATTRLLAALQQRPQVLRYMRTHQPKHLREFAQLLHQYPGLLRSCVERCGVLAAAGHQNMVRKRARMEHSHDAYLEAATEMGPQVVAASQHPWPALHHGCRPDQAGYWIEPATGPLPGRPLFQWTVPKDNMRDPRFLPGQQLLLQRVQAKRELQSGKVYLCTFGQVAVLLRVGRVRGSRVDVCALSAQDTWSMSLAGLFDRAHQGHTLKLYRFVDYTGFSQVLMLSHQRFFQPATVGAPAFTARQRPAAGAPRPNTAHYAAA